MSVRIGKVVSGPFEGARIARGTRPVFVWLGGGPEKPRCYKDPGKDRYLHRSLGVEGPFELFEFAANTHRLCGGCGGFVDVRHGEACCFCGNVLVGAAG